MPGATTMEILLVEDPPNDVLFTREALADAKLDIRLHVARDGEETSSADEDIQQAYCAHVNSYVRKPVNFDRFVEVVQALERYWANVVTLPGRPAAS